MKNINKSIFTTGMTLALLFSAVFVYAQNQQGGNIRSQQVQRENKQANQQMNREVQQSREEAQARVKQIRQDLKQKIGQIKDKKKQDLGNKVMEKIDHVNQTWTGHFANVLDKLDVVLQKIKSRTQKVATNGQDVSAVNTAIAKAETAITTARSAVLDQSQRTYAINASTITGETSTTEGQNNLVSTLRTRFPLLRDQVFKDLFALRDGVMKDARTAVHDVAKTLSQVSNVDKEPVASNNNQ